MFHSSATSVEATFTMVFAALAVTRFIEDPRRWSHQECVRTARRYRTAAPDSTPSPPNRSPTCTVAFARIK